MENKILKIGLVIVIILLFIRFSIDLHQDGVNDGRREYAAQLGQMEMERDILSDIIRNIYDNSDEKQQERQQQIINNYLQIFDCSFDSLGNWSYCY